MLQFKPITRNSNLFAVKRGDAWGVALFSFTQLTGFVDSSSQKIFLVENMPFRTSLAHVRSWLDTIRAGGSIAGLEEFQTIKVPADQLETLFDAFLHV